MRLQPTLSAKQKTQTLEPACVTVIQTLRTIMPRSVSSNSLADNEARIRFSKDQEQSLNLEKQKS